MNWTEAVEAMKKGHHVHRKSEQKRELIGDSDGSPPCGGCDGTGKELYKQPKMVEQLKQGSKP